MFFYHEQLIQSVIDQTNRAVFGVFSASLLFMSIYHVYFPTHFIILWSIAQGIFLILRYINMRMLSQSIRNQAPSKQRNYVIHFLIIMIYSAMIWGWGAVATTLFAPSPFEIIYFTVTLGIVTAAMLSIAPIFFVYSVYYILMLTPHIALFIYLGEIEHLTLLLFLIIYIPSVFLLSQHIYRSYNTTIESNDLLEISIKQLHTLSITDSLTQIYNRRYFFQSAQQSLSNAQRESKPLSLLMIDIDYFKKINDAFGHQTGDYVLIELTKHIQSSLRKGDLFARIGGEEFVILLNNTDLIKARQIAQKICKSVDDYKFMDQEELIKVTISIGVAQSEENSDELQLLYKEADDRLYLAKENGRNRVA